MSDDPLTKLASDYAIGRFEERRGARWYYRLPNDREIVVYGLMFGGSRLVVGSTKVDTWERGYDYGSEEEAREAALRWVDTDKPPPGPWIRQHGEVRK